MVTLVGWFISARLSSRSQRNLFLDGLINSARIDLINAIRGEQDWIRGVTGLGWKFQGEDHFRRFQPPNLQNDQLAYLRHNQETRAALYPSSEPARNLTMVLEEYEQFFPQTKYVRWQLGYRRLRITEEYSPILSDLMNPRKHASAVERMIARQGTDSDYSALLEDLRIHVQNFALSEITGGKIPERQPLDPNVPIMVLRSDGVLEINERGKPWPVLTYPRTPEAESPSHRPAAST